MVREGAEQWRMKWNPEGSQSPPRAVVQRKKIFNCTIFEECNLICVTGLHDKTLTKNKMYLRVSQVDAVEFETDGTVTSCSTFFFP